SVPPIGLTPRRSEGFCPTALCCRSLGCVVRAVQCSSGNIHFHRRFAFGFLMQSHVEVGGAVRGPFDRRPILILVLEDRGHILRAFCSQLPNVFRSHTVSRNKLDLATAHRERRRSVAFATFGLRCRDCVTRLRIRERRRDNAASLAELTGRRAGRDSGVTKGPRALSTRELTGIRAPGLARRGVVPSTAPSES